MSSATPKPGICPEALLASLQADLIALLARAMLESFVKDGYITRDADRVKTQLDFAQGKVSLNGKPFALPDLAGQTP